MQCEGRAVRNQPQGSDAGLHTLLHARICDSVDKRRLLSVRVVGINGLHTLITARVRPKPPAALSPRLSL
jgi:hypothetical protein